MENQQLEQLAAKLRRPVRALSALSCLSDEQLAELERTIGEACERQRTGVDSALRRAFPQPLRSMILGRLQERRG